MAASTIRANRREAGRVFLKIKSSEGTGSNKFKVVRMGMDALYFHEFG